MSQIPRAGGSRPQIKTTSTVTCKTPSGGSKTTTTTRIRGLQPCTTGDRSRASGCQPACSSQRSIRPPQASGIIQAGSQQAQSTSRRRASPSRETAPVSVKPLLPGEYNVPAQYGPMSRAGKGMVYSSPAALRSQMEARLPKDVKFATVKGCPYTEGKSRAALQGTRMADTLAGSFNVYGGPAGRSEQLDRKELNERVLFFMNCVNMK